MIIGCFRRNGDRLGTDSGQALVEAALVLPILALILIGVAELGRVAYVAIQVSNAAKAGVQYGTQNGSVATDAPGIANAAASDAANVTGLTTTSSVSCVCSDGSASTCQPTDCTDSHTESILTVNTQADFNPIFHIPGLPTTFTRRGQAIQKCGQ